MIKNCNLVPKGQWGKWSAGAKGVFNDLYSHMIMNQWAYLHPKQEAVADEHWATICWNASWMAACAADEAIPDIV